MKKHFRTIALTNFIIVLSATCIASAYGQIPPDGIRVILHEFERCGAGAKVVARQDVDLANDAVINALIQKTLDDYRRECPSQWNGLNGFTIRAYYQRNESGFTPDLQMVVNKNGVVTAWNYRTAIDQRNARIEQERQAQVQREMQARQNAEMQRQQAIQQQADAKLQTFVNSHGASGWAKFEVLTSNPFSVEGKVYLFNAKFASMISSRTAVFTSNNFGSAEIIVSDVPKTAFTQPISVVFAGKVLGKTNTKNAMGGEISLPHIKYLGLACTGRDCDLYLNARLHFAP